MALKIGLSVNAIVIYNRSFNDDRQRTDPIFFYYNGTLNPLINEVAFVDTLI